MSFSWLIQKRQSIGAPSLLARDSFVSCVASRRRALGRKGGSHAEHVSEDIPDPEMCHIAYNVLFYHSVC